MKQGFSATFFHEALHLRFIVRRGTLVTMSRLPDRILPETTALMVIDYQERLLPVIHQADKCVAAGKRMIEAAKVLGVPILLTEQNPAGLGRTWPSVAELLKDVPLVEKNTFSACTDSVLGHLRQWARPNILVMGVEAHVCVQQSVLDLIRRGYTVFLCADAVSSRRPLDAETAIERMRQAGAIITTTESAAFELLGVAGTEAFKKILKIVK